MKIMLNFFKRIYHKGPVVVTEMKTQTRIVILIGLISCLFLLSIFLSYRSAEKQTLLYVEDKTKEKFSILEKLVVLYEEPLKAFAFDYSLSDQMVYLVATNRMAGENKNIFAGLAASQSDVAWVYKSDGKLVLGMAITGMDDLLVDSSAVNSSLAAINQKPFNHFFANTSVGLVEIRTAPIQPSCDYSRKMQPRGYFVIGKIWDGDYIARLEESVQAGITLIGSTTDTNSINYNSPKLDSGGISYFTYTLPGPDGASAAKLVCRAEFPLYYILQRDSHLQIKYAAGFCLLNIFLLAIALYYWVGLPLKHISRGIQTNNLTKSSYLRYAGVDFERLGELVSIVSIQRNELMNEIAERKQAEGRLLELKAALRQATDGIAIIDYDGRIKFANESWAQMHGYTVNDIVGEHLSMFHSEEQIQNEVMPFIEAIIINGLFEGEIRRIHKNGNIFPTWMSGSLLNNIDQKPVGLIVVARDLTNQKQLEEAAISAEKMAAIGLLAAGVAHEFNNLLGGIMGNLSLALDYFDNRSLIQTSMADALKATEQATELVQSLLSYSRKNSDAMADINVAKILKDIIILTDKEIKLKSIKLFTDFNDFAAIKGNPGQLQQVFLNMLINAVHAVGDGGIISLITWSDNENTYIEIADDGEGIDPQNLKKIFDPFFSTKGVWGDDAIKGTGLGLSISENIIKSHNGDIFVKSIPKVGTTFTIVLPHIQLTNKIASGNIILSGKTILAIEYDREQSELLSKIFTGNGNDCFITVWGDEAKAMLESKRFDYIILDADHPSLVDFIRLFDYIKANFSTIKVYVSISGRVRYLLEEYVCQSDGIIVKPYSMDNIAIAFTNINS